MEQSAASSLDKHTSVSHELSACQLRNELNSEAAKRPKDSSQPGASAPAPAAWAGWGRGGVGWGQGVRKGGAGVVAGPVGGGGAAGDAAQGQEADTRDAAAKEAAEAALARMVAEPLDPADDDEVSRQRRDLVRGAFAHAWEAYEMKAFGKDEVKPLTGAGADVMGLGLTLVDALDTMLIMGMHNTSAFRRARDWVRDELTAAPQADVSVFECSIRVLGGLLSAHALSGDPGIRDKARMIGLGLLAAFDTPSGLPASVINLAQPAKRAFINPYNGHKNNFGDPSTLAEAGSIQLEMQFLSHVTRDARFARRADESIAKLLSLALPAPAKTAAPGAAGLPLFPVDLHPREGRFVSDRISTGAGGDSFYELLLKQTLMRPFSLRHLTPAVANITRALFERTGGKVPGAPALHFLGASTVAGKAPQKKMEHLSCFAPGMLALYAHKAAPPPAGGEAGGERAWALGLAEATMRTCMEMYRVTRTGLAAEAYEIVGGSPKLVPLAKQRYSLLRPEAVESAFVLWRVTGKKEYREFGWAVFQVSACLCCSLALCVALEEFEHVCVCAVCMP